MNWHNLAARAALCTVALVAGLVASGSALAAVGRTEATYGVNPGGTVAYLIPILATEGINGLTPRIAIKYVDTPDQRSVLGLHFALAGLSAVVPCNQTIAQDGAAAAMVLGAGDRYCLDGARLRLVSGTYGATGAIYRTEVDQLARITSFASTNNVPGWFKVEAHDGLIYEYGVPSDAVLHTSSFASARTQFWALNKISDRSGNSITFLYDKDDDAHRFRPTQIRYTNKNGLVNGNYTIDFVYQSVDQPDAESASLPASDSNGGLAEVLQTRLLERIELRQQSVIYRQYRFTYQTGAGSNSRLASIEECAATTSDCLPTTTFNWQNATPGHGSLVSTGVTTPSALRLDLNGDGSADLAWASGGTWWTMLGSIAGFGPATNTGITATNASKAMPIEWDGDGREDLLVDWSDNYWRVLKGTATGLASPVAAGPGGIPSNTSASIWWIADMDGDGRDDLLRTRATIPLNLKIWARIGSAAGFGAEVVAFNDPLIRPQAGFFGSINERQRSSVRRADFNGDGREDLLIRGCEFAGQATDPCIYTGWYKMYSYGTFFGFATALYDAIGTARPIFADFNGDHLTDLAYVCQAAAKWCANVTTSPDRTGTVSLGPASSGYSSFLYLTGDYNGDGDDDLYIARSTGAIEWDVVKGTGLGIATTAFTTGLPATDGGWTVLDFNGDGLPDLGRTDATGSTWRTLAHLGVAGDRLTSATDGLGNSVAYAYLPMTDPAVYTKGSGAIYPTRDFQSAAPLVRTMTVSPAGGINYSLTYSYANARLDVSGRGFLGMQSRSAIDGRNGMYVAETYEQTFPYTGAPSSITVKQSTAGNAPTIQSVTHTYAHHVLEATAGKQRYLPYRSRTVTKVYEVGGYKDGQQITEITADYTVNTLGNSTFISLKNEDKDSGSSEFGSLWTTEVTSSFSEDLTNWCLALPLSRSDKRILPGGANETRATSWAVSGSGCRITQETIEPGTGSTLSLVTDLGYDSCGNVNSISSYPAGQSGQARITGINYGTRCQRPETITNPLIQASTIGYNWALALPSSETDPNGIPLNFEYDGFGRLTRQLRADGTAARFALTACTSGNGWCGKNSSARVKVTRTERNTADSILRTDEQFLDGFGRLRWSHSDSLESGPAIVETLYDAFGRPSQQTQPYFAGGTVYSTSYARDLVGRVTQINAPIDEANPSGRIVGFKYEGRDIEITDPRILTTTRRSNAIGQPRLVIDPSPGATTSYAYQPFGELASITDAANNLTSWTYNVRGFVTSTSDPDSGSWTYESNVFGETERIRDAKTASPNWTTQFTYDKLSRPLTRSEAEGTTTWTWGTSATAKNIGQLASITSPGGYSEVYSFDSFSRLSQKTVTAEAVAFNINLTYHAQTGLLDTLQYPTSTSGYRLKLAYDYSNNLLQKVRDFNGSTIFWQATSTDAYGHIQDETFGNGVLTYTDFDQASGLMAAREGGIGGGVGQINAQVAWDLNGYLTRRKDLQQSPNITEDIVYDNLNRFDSSQRTVGTGSPAINQDVTLDAIGNINWKLGVGTYAYHATKKRAVISAGSYSFGYDANGNMNARNGSSIGYTSYNLPNVINAGSSSSTISYGAFRNRYKQVSSGSIAETTIYVAGLLEKVTRGSVTEYRHLIAGGKGIATIYTRRSNATNSTYYVQSDHLGSPEVVTDSAGTVIVRLSFGAYGERRDKDWDGPVSAPDLTALANVFRHGFTGHEHLDAVGLIHMNGRVYEPVAGRFLEVDPIVQLGFSQSPNSFAYVWNNPLTLIDPTGFTEDFPWCGPQDRNGICSFPDLDGGTTGMSPDQIRQILDSLGGLGGNSSGGPAGSRGRGANLVLDRKLSPCSAANAGPEPMGTRIVIGFTDSRFPFASHAFVIAYNLSSGKVVATRGGPGSGPGGGRGVRSGQIVGIAGPYNVDFPDQPGEVEIYQPVGTVALSIDEVAARMVDFARVTNTNDLQYLPWLNSNSYAFTFVESLGFERPEPIVSWAPGWQAGNPSDKLSCARQ